MKILITSGGTKEPIDSIRHISNMSKGKFGAALAKVFYHLGHDVLLFRAEDAKECSLAEEATFRTYEDYSSLLQHWVASFKPDVVIAAAAVGDFVVDRPYIGQKIPSGSDFYIRLVPAPKVLPLIKKTYPETKLVGFKLLANATEDEFREAAFKVLVSGPCDMVAANDIINRENPQYDLYYPNGKIVKLEPGENLVWDFAHKVIELCEN